MSDDAAELAPTASNFDAVIAANEAKLNAREAPDTTENDDVSEIDPSEVEEVEEEPEATEDDDSEEESDDDEAEEDDPTAQPAEVAMRAPYKALREARKAGKFTPELMAAVGDLPIDVETVNGIIQVRPSEIAGHVMRESRFSREMAKTKEVQARSERIIQIEQARTNAWRQNPGELEHGLQVMGCKQALDALHLKWAKDTHAFLSLPPHEQQRIQLERQSQAQRAQYEQQMYQMQQRLKQYEQQSAPVIDEPTKQAGDFIDKNMDSALGEALKAAGAGRVNNDLRLALVNELTELAQEGYPLPLAMKEAARSVAERERKMKTIARGQAAEAEKKKPKEVSGKRAPAGNAPPKRDNDGRFQPPSRSSNGKRSKVPPTAASFGERFGV
jgi:hypothetical protein